MADKADWTIMVYLAGDNNLTEEMVWALKEMKTWALTLPKWKKFPQIDEALEQGKINEAQADLIKNVANLHSESEADWIEKAEKLEINDLEEEVRQKTINLKIVAQFDPSGVGIPTQRYDFQKEPAGGGELDGDLHEWRVTKIKDDSGTDVDFLPGETNTGNPTALSDFVAWGAKRHPAEHYMVILSGHGSGTTEDFLMKDENALDALSIPELQLALKDAREKIQKEEKTFDKIDILGMDCCFMSMAEVCDSLKDYANIVVGAEGYEPESGWPYNRLLQAVKENPSHYRDKPDNMAKMIVDRYVRFYSDYDRTAGRSVDLAAVKLDGMDLTGPLEDLAGLLDELVKDEDKQEQLVLAHWESQTYKFDQFVDLRDLCECLLGRAADLKTKEEEEAETKVKETQLVMKCLAVIKAVNDCVIGSGCAGFACQYSHGLSIYFPWAKISEDYTNVGFGKTSWHKFLQSYVAKTSRPAQIGFDKAEDKDERKRWEDAVVNIFLNVVESAEDDHNRHTLRTKFEQRLRLPTMRKRLLGQLTPIIRQFEGAGEGHRYDRSRYDRSRYDRSRYADAKDIWVKNPPVTSGIRFENQGVKVDSLLV